jgi:elongation factor G
MKVYETSDIRNVALVGHGHSGKTALTSALRLTAGATPRLETITDFDDEEIARKITISSAVAAIEWKGKKINLIDTPGFNIFINDTRGTLIAADAALVIVDGIAGVEVQTEKVWNFTDEFVLPRAVVINKLDRNGPVLSAPSKTSSPRSDARRFRFSCPSAPRRTSKESSIWSA